MLLSTLALNIFINSDSALWMQSDCWSRLTWGSEGRWRTVCRRSLWWWRDSSSYTRSRSVWGRVRKRRIVQRFSHSVRFSGLGLSFQRSNSHSQPWHKKSGRMTGSQIETKGERKSKREMRICEIECEMERDMIISARLGQSLIPAVVGSQPLPAPCVNNLISALSLSFSLCPFLSHCLSLSRPSWPAAADGCVQPWPPNRPQTCGTQPHLSHACTHIHTYTSTTLLYTRSTQILGLGWSHLQTHKQCANGPCLNGSVQHCRHSDNFMARIRRSWVRDQIWLNQLSLFALKWERDLQMVQQVFQNIP